MRSPDHLPETIPSILRFDHALLLIILIVLSSCHTPEKRSRRERTEPPQASSSPKPATIRGSPDKIRPDGYDKLDRTLDARGNQNNADRTAGEILQERRRATNKRIWKSLGIRIVLLEDELVEIEDKLGEAHSEAEKSIWRVRKTTIQQQLGTARSTYRMLGVTLGEFPPPF